MATHAAAENGSFARRAAVLVALIVSLAVTTGACLPEGRACSPGDYVPCTCSSGDRGAATCNDEGTAYGACECLLLDGGLAADAAIVCTGSTSLPVACACASNADCASNDCYPFPSKGSFCTQSCTRDTDCPPPSPGCNPRMICKVP